MELVAPAKHRKATAATSSNHASAAVLHGGSLEDGDARSEAADKDRHKPAGGSQVVLYWAWGFIYRRRLDACFICYYWGRNIWLYQFCTSTFPDVLPEWAAFLYGFVYWALCILLNLSLLSIRCHGPGHVPTSSGETVLPAQLASALRAGRFAKPPFGCEDSWCNECGRTKPPLVHHCRVCKCCSLWMDHHCNYAGTCIGFKNHRNFVLWTIYGMMSEVVAAVTGLIWLGLEPLHSLSSFCYGAAGVAFAAFDFYEFFSQFRIAHAFISTGWPSQVLRAKFRSLRENADLIKRELAAQMEELERDGDDQLSLVRDAVQQLHSSIDDLTGGGGPIMMGLFNLFRGDNLASSMELVFGEPIGWRWAIPWFAGGSGKPLSPEVYDPVACRRWANLDVAIEKCLELKSKLQKQDLDRQKEWEMRVASLLRSAGQGIEEDETIQCAA